MERKKAEKRDRITSAAEKLIAKKGYWEMTIDDVARDADVAKGTVYLYYNSKESLCAAVLTRILRDMNDAISEHLQGVEGGSHRNQVMADAIITFSMKYPERYRVLDQAMTLKYKDLSDENVQEFVRVDDEQLQMMVENYKLAIAEGSIRSDVDPLPTALFMRMALWVAFNPFPCHAMVMDLNGVDRMRFLGNARDLILYATHEDAKKWISYNVPPVKKHK